MRVWIKDQKNPLRNSRRNIIGLLASSAHGIIICLILCGSVSWAWFTEVISGPSITVQTASYGLHVDVVSGNVVVTGGDYFGATDEDNYAIEVENGNVYEIILSVPTDEEGNLRQGYAEYGGYCIVSAGDDLHYTVPIGGEKDGVKNPEEISFKIWFPGTGSSRIEFVPYWGTYPSTLPTKWKDICIDIIEDRVEYIVSGGDITVSSADNNQ